MIRPQPGGRDPSGGLVEANDPRHQVWVHGRANLPRDLELEVHLRRIGRLRVPGTPACTEANLRVGWSASPRLDWSIVGRDLLHARHVEFASPTSPRRIAPERGVLVHVAIAF